MSLTKFAKKNKLLIILVSLILVIVLGPKFGLFSVTEEQCNSVNKRALFGFGFPTLDCDWDISIFPPGVDQDCEPVIHDCTDMGCKIQYHPYLGDLEQSGGTLTCEDKLQPGEFTTKESYCEFDAIDKGINFFVGDNLYSKVWECRRVPAGQDAFLCKMGQILPDSLGSCNTRGIFVMFGGMFMAGILLIAVI